ncbi:MAG: acyloxyacyl hydrolase [Crocinitomicaceae bacterium]|nr:acyloxyacyl hydrolase [Crocinitomicaceae bacterium]
MKRNLFIAILFLSSSVRAQFNYEYGFEYKQKVGILLAHHEIMSHIPNSLSYAGELSFYIHSKGNEKWHKSYAYPSYGVTLFGASLGNDSILGKSLGLFPFIEFPFIRKKHFVFSGRLGAGLGYISKRYDKNLNPKNVAMSSALNALVTFGLKATYLYQASEFSFGVDMTHLSNAAFKMPNLGINLPYLSLSYGYTLQQKSLDTLVKTEIVPKKKWLIGATFIASTKENSPTGGERYPVYALSMHGRRFFNAKTGLELALDVISKQSLKGIMTDVPKTQSDLIQVGLFAGFLLPLDQFHFVLGMGAYVHDKFKPDGLLYHRIGMRYYFKNGLNAQLVLHSHWGRADYAEWGVGYTFNHKK